MPRRAGACDVHFPTKANRTTRLPLLQIRYPGHRHLAISQQQFENSSDPCVERVRNTTQTNMGRVVGPLPADPVEPIDEDMRRFDIAARPL